MASPEEQNRARRRTLGIWGGGQLGRMLALAARPLGIDVTVIDPNPEAPAQVAARHIVAEFDDRDALSQLARCDWITFEFENIPEEIVQRLEGECAVNPGALALRTAQDRWVEKNTFLDLGIATPQFRRIDSLTDAQSAFAELGALVLKTRRFGYDGKGQAVIRSQEDLAAGYASLKGAPAIAEELVPFDREMSVIVCRGTPSDDSAAPVEIYPITENVHRSGILQTSTAPAPHLNAKLQEAAENAARLLVNRLNYVGILALELFQVGDRLLANEFAPRVHNSGHWTIEGAVTSQFENHVRAVTGLPLGSAALRAPSVMTNLVGSKPAPEKLLAIPDTHLHDYDKAPRQGRKVGHVTSLGQTLEEARARAARVAQLLP